MESMFTILSAYCDENALHISLDGVHSWPRWKAKISTPMLQSLIKQMYHSAHFSNFFVSMRNFGRVKLSFTREYILLK
jgi:hypothetical protein